MPRESLAADFYGLPTYFITNAVSEVVGFNVRIYHWENRGGILAPLFIAVVPAAELANITSDVRATADQSMRSWGSRFGLEREPRH